MESRGRRRVEMLSYVFDDYFLEMGNHVVEISSLLSLTRAATDFIIWTRCLSLYGTCDGSILWVCFCKAVLESKKVSLILKRTLRFQFHSVTILLTMLCLLCILPPWKPRCRVVKTFIPLYDYYSLSFLPSYDDFLF